MCYLRFDYWGDGCAEFGALCPPGAFPGGWANVTALINRISPDTMFLPGPDGCLDDGSVENGVAAYPNWNYRSPEGNPPNPVRRGSAKLPGLILSDASI